MKNLTLTILVFILSGCSLFAQAKGDGILGEWLSPKKDTRFLIFKEGSKYFGKIQWGLGKETKDINNPDPKLRSQDLIGLVILKGLGFDGQDAWTDGTIYDPREGKTYSCKISMKSNQELVVRGYIAISLFGRSETWSRNK